MNPSLLSRVIAASVQGAGHEKTEQPCQDAHFWRVLPEGSIIAAVADGAGSAPLGELGATIATQTAVEMLFFQLLPRCSEDEATQTEVEPPLSPELPWDDLLIEALEAAQIAVRAEASEQRATMRALATTLILVAITPEMVAGIQVGDGAAVVRDADGTLHTLTPPQHGEYINETSFITSADTLDTAQTYLWQGSTEHVALFSDGLQMLALQMPLGTPHAPFFQPLFRFAEEATDEAEARNQLVRFLHSSRIRERTDDDVTLLLAAFVTPDPVRE